MTRTAGLRTPTAVVVACALLWIPWGAWQIADDRVDLLPRVGRLFMEAGRGSSAAIDRHAVIESAVGYDGQFFLYMAMDPTGAESYLDKPGYRYSRIVYPIVARAVSLGQAQHAALALLMVGILSTLAATWAVARFLFGAGVSAWYALIYGLSPAVAIAVHRDVAEPLAWAFAAYGLLVLDTSRVRLIGAAALFAAAGLTHDATVVVPVGAAIALYLRRRREESPDTPSWSRLAAFLGLSVVPAVVWRLFLQTVVEEHRPGLTGFEPLPLAGLIRAGWPTSLNKPEVVYAVLVPALIGLALVLLARVRPPSPALFVLALATLFVLCLPKLSFDGFASTGRLGLGTVLAFVMCIPLVDPARRALVVLPPTIAWAASWMLIAGDVFHY